MKLIICTFLTILSLSLAFLHSQIKFNNKSILNARRKTKDLPDEELGYTPGVDVPEEILKQNTIYDMYLVERISSPEKTDFGLFLPKIEGKDKKQLGLLIQLFDPIFLAL